MAAGTSTPELSAERIRDLARRFLPSPPHVVDLELEHAETACNLISSLYQLVGSWRNLTPKRGEQTTRARQDFTKSVEALSDCLDYWFYGMPDRGSLQANLLRELSEGFDCPGREGRASAHDAVRFWAADLLESLLLADCDWICFVGDERQQELKQLTNTKFRRLIPKIINGIDYEHRYDMSNLWSHCQLEAVLAKQVFERAPPADLQKLGTDDWRAEEWYHAWYCKRNIQRDLELANQRASRIVRCFSSLRNLVRFDQEPNGPEFRSVDPDGGYLLDLVQVTMFHLGRAGRRLSSLLGIIGIELSASADGIVTVGDVQGPSAHAVAAKLSKVIEDAADTAAGGPLYDWKLLESLPDGESPFDAADCKRYNDKKSAIHRAIVDSCNALIPFTDYLNVRLDREYSVAVGRRQLRAATAPAKPRPLISKLTDADWDILRSVVDLEGKGRGHRITVDMVVKEARGGLPTSYNKNVGRLKEAGYVVTQRGRGGSIQSTQAGREAVTAASQNNARTISH